MPRAVVVDTGYWLALFDAKDQYYSQAQAKARYIESLTVIFPWPILYETLGTRFVKNRSGMINFERILKRHNACFIQDALYRDAALERVLLESQHGRRALSLCDMILRLMMQDQALRIDALLTFNPRDFSDVCRSAKVELL